MNNKIALLLIDIQKGFSESYLEYWGERNNPAAEKNISLLLQTFRKKSLPIFHVQHLSTLPKSPLRPGQAGVEFMDIVKPLPHELVFQKNVNSAFIGTELEKSLRENSIDTVIVAGISTDHCVSTSVRMASNLGFKVYVAADATIAFARMGFDGIRYSADDVYAISLASLHEEFATVLNTADLIRKTEIDSSSGGQAAGRRCLSNQ